MGFPFGGVHGQRFLSVSSPLRLPHTRVPGEVLPPWLLYHVLFTMHFIFQKDMLGATIRPLVFVVAPKVALGVTLEAARATAWHSHPS